MYKRQPLTWGRDGSEVRLGSGQARFKAGPITMPYTPGYVAGRHIIDTYQQIQRYDIGGRLTSYGLKPAVEQLGLTRTDREFVPGEQISDAWHHDRDRLLRYALDDVRDVAVLSDLATPTEFYQSQLLPRAFPVSYTHLGAVLHEQVQRVVIKVEQHRIRVGLRAQQ